MKNLQCFRMLLVAVSAFIAVLFLIVWLQGVARAQETVQASAPLESLANNDDLIGWTNAGLYGATVSKVVFDPLRDRVFMTVAGGSYMSANGGQSWTLITQDSSGGVAVDPVSGTVYLGVWESYQQEEVWTSDDGGATWVQHGGFDGLPNTIALDPHDGQVAFMGTSSWDHPQGGKVFRSLNGGNTWQGAAVDIGYCISAVAVDPLNVNRVWAVSGSCNTYPDHSAVYLSTNRGLTYTEVFSSANGYEYTQIAFDPAGHLFLMGDGLRISHNSGITFTAEIADETIPWSDNKSLIFDPVTGRAYRQATGTYYSDDGGLTWHFSTLPRLYAINPENNQHMFSGGLPGLFRTLNGGLTWEKATTGLEHDVVSHLDGPTNEPVIYASTHQGFGRSLDGGLTWDFPSGIGNYSLAVDPITPGKVYVETGPSQYSTSTDYGEHWTSTDITTTNSQITSQAVDPGNGNILYAGLSTLRANPGGSVKGSGLYASLDGGSTWNQVGLVDRQVYVIKAARYPTGTLIYAGLNYDASGVFDGGIYRGLSGGNTWTLVGFGGSNINDLAVDPTDPSHLLAAVGHWYPTLQPMGLYESHNAGDTWEKVIFEPSNDIAAYSVLFDPFDPAIIYLGAGFHLYRSLDSGQNWSHIEATSNRDFHTLFIPYGDQVRLFVGTGEGVYYRPVGSREAFDPLAGGALVFTDTLGFEARFLDDGGAVTNTTTLYYVDLSPRDISGQPGMIAVHAFQVNAYQGSVQLDDFNFQQPVTVTLVYPDMPGLNENTLRLLSWTGTGWVDAACGPYYHDPVINQLVVPVCQAGRFGLFIEQYKTFLPLIVR